jgi:hypothetical protein
MPTLKLVKKWESSYALNNVLNPLHFFHPHKVWATRVKENNEKEKKWKNEQLWTLVYILVLPTMNSPLNSFLGLNQLVSSKMMPCTLNHNMICLGLGPLSKGFKTNLKFLTNSNTQFHWTLPLGPLFKVAFSIPFSNPINMKFTLVVLNKFAKQCDGTKKPFKVTKP